MSPAVSAVTIASLPSTTVSRACVLLEAAPTQTTLAAFKAGIPASAGEQRPQILQQQGNRGKQPKAAEEVAAPGFRAITNG